MTDLNRALEVINTLMAENKELRRRLAELEPPRLVGADFFGITGTRK